jgi:hypothetical protein
VLQKKIHRYFIDLTNVCTLFNIHPKKGSFIDFTQFLFSFWNNYFSQVIRDTNFLDDLYAEDELSSEKDRDGKMKFLQKLIDVVSE